MAAAPGEEGRGGTIIERDGSADGFFSEELVGGFQVEEGQPKGGGTVDAETRSRIAHECRGIFMACAREELMPRAGETLRVYFGDFHGDELLAEGSDGVKGGHGGGHDGRGEYRGMCICGAVRVDEGDEDGGANGVRQRLAGGARVDGGWRVDCSGQHGLIFLHGKDQRNIGLTQKDLDQGVLMCLELDFSAAVGADGVGTLRFSTFPGAKAPEEETNPGEKGREPFVVTSSLELGVVPFLGVLRTKAEVVRVELLTRGAGIKSARKT